MEIAGYPLRRLRSRLVEGIDPTLFTLVLLLSLLGLGVLYSASYENTARVTNQMVSLLVAIVAMWVVAQVPPQTLARLAVPAYVLGVALLVAVALGGEVVNGARRWLNLGVARFQPSEMMKIAMPMMLAWFFDRNAGANRLRHFAFAGLLLAVPVAMVARQPDLGTALLIAAAGFYVIFLAGINWKVLAGLGVLALASVFPLWGMLHDYQRRRILTLFDPSQDPLGAGYHTIQSTIAVGSGGLTGKGWLNGSQTHLEFIPERHTDFIFAVYSEEFGLLGNVALLVLYALLIARGVSIAASATTVFGRLLAGAVTLIFFTYAFVNMGMVAGMLPVVGVPLPFISYGGSALLTLYVGVGLLMSIQRHRKLIPT